MSFSAALRTIGILLKSFLIYIGLYGKVLAAFLPELFRTYKETFLTVIPRKFSEFRGAARNSAGRGESWALLIVINIVATRNECFDALKS